jgi:hypothetical protein
MKTLQERRDDVRQNLIECGLFTPEAADRLLKKHADNPLRLVGYKSVKWNVAHRRQTQDKCSTTRVPGMLDPRDRDCPECGKSPSPTWPNYFGHWCDRCKEYAIEF